MNNLFTHTLTKKFYLFCLIPLLAVVQVFGQAPAISYSGGPQTYTVGVAIAPLTPSNSGGAVGVATPGIVTTLAGNTGTGHTNGNGAAASFAGPTGIAIDAAGNVYVADRFNFLIRKVTPTGDVTTFAGSGAAGAIDGTGIAATFDNPVGLAFDHSGNLYVTDQGNKLIRKITPAGVVSTIIVSGASFGTLYGIAVDAFDNIFVSDQSSNLIYKITPGGSASVFAGSGTAGNVDGTGAGASFSDPTGIALDLSGNLYVADRGNSSIRKITASGVVTKLAGSFYGSADGTGSGASFGYPYGVATDAAGNVYIADSNHMIREITPSGVVTTLAGSPSSGSANGTGAAASFNYPNGIGVDATGNVYIGDTGNHLIREITSTLAYTISPALPAGLTFNSATGVISGTPTVLSSITTYTITAYNASGHGSTTQDISIVAPAPTVSYAGPQNYTVGTAITPLAPTSTGVAASGGYSVSPALPAGLILDVNTGIISGTPTTLSLTASYTVTVINPGATASAMASIVITVGAAPIIIPPVVIPPTVSYATPQTYTAGIAIAPLTPTTGGGAPSVGGYSISPALSTGLSFDVNTGIISGTPTSANPLTIYTITVVNTGGSGTAPLSITVVPAVPVIIPPIVPPGLLVSAPSITYTTPQTYITGALISPLAPTNAGGAVGVVTPNVVTTIAGNAGMALVNGTGLAASFGGPAGVVTDAIGNLYVADRFNNVIRKITPAGVVTTYAGDGTNGMADGAAASASFNSPMGVAIDGSGNIYVADFGNNLVRKISATGTVTTLGGGLAAALNGPYGITADAAGNVFVTDQNNGLVKEISTLNVVTTVAAGFNRPAGITIDGSGNLFVADAGSSTILKIAPGGAVSTFAGSGQYGSTDGFGTSASFGYPYGIAADGAGNLYVTNANNTIRKITPAGIVTTIAGSPTSGTADGTGVAASFNYPTGIAVDATGTLYIGDSGNNLIRQISSSLAYVISPALPDGLAFDQVTGIISGTPTSVSAPAVYTVTAYNAGGHSSFAITISVVVAPLALHKPALSYTTPQILTAGYAKPPFLVANSGGPVGFVMPGDVSNYVNGGNFGGPTGIAIDKAGNAYVADRFHNQIRKITSTGVVSVYAGTGNTGSTDGVALSATFSYPTGVTLDQAGNLYVADLGNNLVRKISPAGIVSTFAGSGSAGFANGTGTGASFNTPFGVVADKAGNIFVSDQSNNVIRKITPAGVVSTFAGAGGTTFNNQTGITIDKYDVLYVADRGNSQIKRISPAGVVSTYAGIGYYGAADGPAHSASFGYPYGIAADSAGNVYVAESSNTIRLITPSGTVSTLAGSNSSGMANGTGAAASFNYPNGIAVDSVGNLYVGDTNNNLVRHINSILNYTIDPALPAGLNFNTLTGTISGTATTPQLARDYVITGYNAAGFSETTLNITVIPPPVLLPIPIKTLGNPDFAAVGISLLPITYASSDLSVATVTGATVHIVAAGSCIISATSNGVTVTQGLTVTPPPVFPPMPVKTMGNPNFAPGATCVLPITYSSDDLAVATIVAGNIHLVGAGTCTISATSNGVTVTQPLTVTPAPVFPAITPPTYGAADFDPGASSALSITYTTGNSAVATIVAGKLHIVGIGSSLITALSNGVSVAQTITVLPAALTVTADDQSKVYGDVNPALTITYTGFVNGETSAALSTLPTISTTATSASGVGTYPISISGATAANYSITFAPGTLTVTPAVLTITAYNQSKVYGTANPALTVSFSGFVNSETTSILSVQPIAITAATAASGAGTYPITASGASAANYSFVYVAGTLTITPAPLTITAVHKRKIVGDANPTFTATYTGFVNGDVAASLTTAPVFATTADVSSIAGSYPITVSGAASANYTITYVAGTLTVSNGINTPYVFNVSSPSGNPDPYVVPALSPDGDGINDFLSITNISFYTTNTLKIFNQTGTKVFEQANYDNVSNVFDGHSNVGGVSTLPPGIYFYILSYTDVATIKRITGFIVIM